MRRSGESGSPPVDAREGGRRGSHCAYKERSPAAKSCQRGAFRGALKNSAAGNNIERVVSRIVASSSPNSHTLSLYLLIRHSLFATIGGEVSICRIFRERSWNVSLTLTKRFRA